MLSETPIVSAKIDEYNVLTALFGTPFPDLFSLQRGMVEMSGISEREWNERSVQLGGKVDGESGLEARFEHFLLGIGRQGLEEWLQVVTMAMEMGDKQRVEWAGVYGDASQFLWIAIESVGMEKWW